MASIGAGQYAASRTILNQLAGKSGPKAGAAAFLLGQISEGRFDFRQALTFYRRAYLFVQKIKII